MDQFTALAHPKRRQIVEMLTSGELAAGDIARRFDVTPAAVSQHLKVLQAAELVRVRVDGQRRMYSLDPAGFSDISEWLDGIGRFWTERLDILKRELERDDGGRRRKGKNDE